MATSMIGNIYTVHAIRSCWSNVIGSVDEPRNKLDIKNGHSHCDVTHCFVDYHFEALSLAFGRRHLVF